MKKFIAVFTVLILTASVVWAATPGTPEYERLKEYKKAKREKRETLPPGLEKKEPGFWEKEGERSGLGRMQNPLGFVKNLNPAPFFKSQQEQYEARKNAAQKSGN